jgi:serine/threonine-protein kinase
VNDAATLCETLSAPIPPLREVAPLVPVELERIVARALSRDVESRFESASAMADALRAWLATCEQQPDQTDLARVLEEIAGDLADAQQELIALCLGGTDVHSTFADDEARECLPELPATLTELEPVVPAASSVPPRRAASAPWWAAAAVFATTVGFLVAFSEPALVSEVTERVALRRVDVLPIVPRAALEQTAPDRAASQESTLVLSPAAESTPGAPPPAVAPVRREGDTAGGGGVRTRRSVVSEAHGAGIALHAKPADGLDARLSERRVGVEAGAARSGHSRTPPSATAATANGETVEYGFLSLDTTPWAQVSLGDDLLGTTPLIGVRLPAGTHVLSLENPDRGIRQEYRVTVRPGETTGRRLGLD